MSRLDQIKQLQIQADKLEKLETLLNAVTAIPPDKLSIKLADTWIKQDTAITDPDITTAVHKMITSKLKNKIEATGVQIRKDTADITRRASSAKKKDGKKTRATKSKTKGQ